MVFHKLELILCKNIKNIPVIHVNNPSYKISKSISNLFLSNGRTYGRYQQELRFKISLLLFHTKIIWISIIFDHTNNPKIQGGFLVKLHTDIMQYVRSYAKISDTLFLISQVMLHLEDSWRCFNLHSYLQYFESPNKLKIKQYMSMTRYDKTKRKNIKFNIATIHKRLILKSIIHMRTSEAKVYKWQKFYSE